MSNYLKSLIALPESLQNLIRFAVDTLKPTEVILFGSRARGDHRVDSDYDIAFKGVTDKKAWTRFLIEQENQPISLLKCDLVYYEDLADDYHKNIKKDGVTLYKV